MAIRDTFRRAMRRSESSAASSHNESSNSSAAASTADSEQQPLHKTSSRITTWSWGSNSKEKEPKERKPKNKTRSNKRPVVHPSQRPLTAQNLAHQEMLSHFTMTFGTSRPEQIETASFVGISPCCTRTPSLVGDSDDDYTNSSGTATPQLSDSGR